MSDPTDIRDHLKIVSEEFRFDATDILEAAKAKKFETMAIIGFLEDGKLYVAGNANLGETLVMLEKFRYQIGSGEFD